MKFTKEHKKIALSDCSYDYLMKKYLSSERDLRKACRTGDSVAMSDAMKIHQKYEYALLYRNTPDFRKNLRGKI